jgi:hypothetical protein
MFITLLTVALTTLFDSQHGTALAAIVTPEELVIAADSRVVNSADQPLDDTCKIRIVHGTIITGHGMAESQDTGYDLFALAATAARQAASVQEVATALARAAPQPVAAALAALRAGQPDAFERKAADSTPGVILARWEGERPALGYVRFVLKRAGHTLAVQPVVHLCPGQDCPHGVAGVFAAPGLADTQEFQLRHPHYAPGNLVDTARRFVQAQIDRRWPSVGPPIDIIRLKRGTAAWVQRQVSCPPA